jgi:PadR family transcriptional regulator PadR
MAQKQLENMALELRRGVIGLAVLSRLRQEHYGYSLIKLLNEQGLEIDQGTLYPLLRRLESSGLLKSEWRVEGPRPRRYYRTSGDGEEALRVLGEEWSKLVEVMEGLLS